VVQLLTDQYEVAARTDELLNLLHCGRTKTGAKHIVKILFPEQIEAVSTHAT
jgi:hypothetical protein